MLLTSRCCTITRTPEHKKQDYNVTDGVWSKWNTCNIGHSSFLQHMTTGFFMLTGHSFSHSVCIPSALLRLSRASCPLTINFLVAFFLYGLIIVLELSLSVLEIAQFCRGFILFLKWSRNKNPCSIKKLKPNWNWVFEADADKDGDFFFC